jgi:hypothetical protein
MIFASAAFGRCRCMNFARPKKAGPKTSPLKVWERMPERRFPNASNRILLQTQKIDQHVRKKR